MIKQREPIVAIATPYGESSIGVLRLSGEGILEKLKDLLKTKKDIKPRYAHFFELLDQEGRVLDEGVLIYYKSPHSYTGEDMLELQLHGNPLILKKALEVIMSKGIRLAKPGEFTKRAFLNGKMDLTQAEAVMDLITAKTDLAREIALNQLRGELSKLINPLREKLIEMLAYIEADIEFAHEDIPTITKEDIISILTDIIKNIEDLLATVNKGEFIRKGINLAIVGKPNVGKSSLFNALLGHDRSIVTHIPGTTRDYLQEQIHIKGIPINLIDTAGIRDAQDEVERIGVLRSLERIENAHLILFVLDGSKPIDKYDEKVYNLIRNKKHLVVLNKKDLGMNQQTLNLFQDAIVVSAKTLEGIENLKECMLSKVGVFSCDSFNIYISLRHAELLDKARSILKEISSKLMMFSISPEILALEIKEALSYIEDIVGVITTEDVLENIFSRFCIGK